MPYDKKRFPERSRARLSKEGQVIARAEPKPVAISMHLEPDAKIKEPRDTMGNSMEGLTDEKTGKIIVTHNSKLKVDAQKIEGAKKTENTSTNVKKEEPTPENNDVKTDSKE